MNSPDMESRFVTAHVRKSLNNSGEKTSTSGSKTVYISKSADANEVDTKSNFPTNIPGLFERSLHGAKHLPASETIHQGGSQKKHNSDVLVSRATPADTAGEKHDCSATLGLNSYKDLWYSSACIPRSCSSRRVKGRVPTYSTKGVCTNDRAPLCHISISDESPWGVPCSYPNLCTVPEHAVVKHAHQNASICTQTSLTDSLMQDVATQTEPPLELPVSVYRDVLLSKGAKRTCEMNQCSPLLSSQLVQLESRCPKEAASYDRRVFLPPKGEKPCNYPEPVVSIEQRGKAKEATRNLMSTCPSDDLCHEHRLACNMRQSIAEQQLRLLLRRQRLIRLILLNRQSLRTVPGAYHRTVSSIINLLRGTC